MSERNAKLIRRMAAMTGHPADRVEKVRPWFRSLPAARKAMVRFGATAEWWHRKGMDAYIFPGNGIRRRYIRLPDFPLQERAMAVPPTPRQGEG